MTTLMIILNIMIFFMSLKLAYYLGKIKGINETYQEVEDLFKSTKKNS